MGSFGLVELALLVCLPAAALVIASFCLALAAFRRVRSLERRLDRPHAETSLRR